MRVGYRILLGAFTFFIASSALAVDPNPPGKLALHVAISDDPDFVKEWLKTPPSHSITIHRIHEAHIGQTAYIAFIVTGHRANSNGVPNLEIDVIVRKPDGSILADKRSFSRVKYRTGEGGFVLGDPVLNLTLDEGDPLGRWKIEGTVRDKLAGGSASTTSTLEVRQ